MPGGHGRQDATARPWPDLPSVAMQVCPLRPRPNRWRKAPILRPIPGPRPLAPDPRGPFPGPQPKRVLFPPAPDPWPATPPAGKPPARHTPGGQGPDPLPPGGANPPKIFYLTGLPGPKYIAPAKGMPPGQGCPGFSGKVGLSCRGGLTVSFEVPRSLVRNPGKEVATWAGDGGGTRGGGPGRGWAPRSLASHQRPGAPGLLREVDGEGGR